VQITVRETSQAIPTTLELLKTLPTDLEETDILFLGLVLVNDQFHNQMDLDSLDGIMMQRAHYHMNIILLQLQQLFMLSLQL
jgi:hypothetical protein